MLRELAVNTRVIYYLMALLGIIGVLAKAVNQQTLNQMLKAAGNMSKSTHRLIKLVRAKYEHACMVHDSVENTNAFVEKYIYEYRGFLFGIHTWRQMQLLTVWLLESCSSWCIRMLYYLWIFRCGVSIYRNRISGDGTPFCYQSSFGRTVQA